MTSGSLIERLPKSWHDFIWSLPFLDDRAPVLVIVHDGVALTGAAVVRKGKQWRIAGSGRSSAASFSAAVGDVLGQCAVRVQKAILVCGSTVSALVDLPIEADQPKPAREMLGLVRWELEPLMAEQAAAWNLGAVLMARGHIDQQGRQLLVEEQARRQSGGSGASPRFGEIAIDLGLVQREQIEECLAAQSQLQSLDDHVVCAWSDQGVPSEGGRSLWLAGGIGLAVQQRWIDACARHDVRLETIVPLAGAGFLAHSATPEAGVYVELTANTASVLRLRGGSPERLAVRPVSGERAVDVLHGMLADFLLPDDTVIRAFVPRPDAAQICEALHQATGRRIDVPKPVTDGGAAQEMHPAVSAWLPLLTAVVHSNRVAGGRVLPSLPAAEPLPPPIRRPQTWAMAGAVLLTVCVSSYEVIAAVRQKWMQNEVAELSGLKARNEQQVLKAAEDKRKATALVQEVEKIKAEHQAAQQALDFYRKDLGGRREFLHTTMKVLPEVVSSEVVLESVEEVRWFELSVKAWSISQSAAYRFAKDMTAGLGDWRFEVHDLQVKAQSGRAGQEGYGLQFRLVRASAASAATTPQPGGTP